MGGPFVVLIKVSLAIFVALVVGPFWLLVKLIQLLAGVAAQHEAEQRLDDVRVRVDDLAAQRADYWTARLEANKRRWAAFDAEQARIAEQQAALRARRPQSHYSNRR